LVVICTGGVIITFHDVTERERAVSELLLAKQVSEDASRLKSEFIANMNHELRTPLNAILGFSEIIMNDAQNKLSEGRYRDYAKDINRSGAQLLSIINDILDFAKSDAKQLTLNEELIEATTLISDSVRFVTPVANKKGVTLIVKVAPNMPNFRGDERRLRQILLNLLSNAVKFTPAEREVRVLAGLNEAGGVQIDVEDTGIGIPPDQINRVMEPFYQVDGSLARTQEGTGLGLPIAKSLAELHGGTLRLESAVGYGTTARLTLPSERTVRQTGRRLSGAHGPHAGAGGLAPLRWRDRGPIGSPRNLGALHACAPGPGAAADRCVACRLHRRPEFHAAVAAERSGLRCGARGAAGGRRRAGATNRGWPAYRR